MLPITQLDLDLIKRSREDAIAFFKSKRLRGWPIPIRTESGLFLKYKK